MNAFDIEKIVRERLGEMFGTRFRKQRLVTGYDSNNLPQIHEFDIVSENADIIGEIKAGKCTSGNFSLALADCLYLSKMKARTKLMTFTDKELYEYFKKHSKGLISDDIQPILITDAKLMTVERSA